MPMWAIKPTPVTLSHGKFPPFLTVTHMTRRNSTDSQNSTSSKPVRKRIRDNHNELERVRRNNQKAHLEALRMALPFQDMDAKASMVSIFIRAREYIGMLEQRIIELQSGETPALGYPAGSALSPTTATAAAATSSRTSKLPSILNPQNEGPSLSLSGSSSPFRGRERELSVNPDHVQVHHGIPFYNPGFMSSASNGSNSGSSTMELPSHLGPTTQRPSSPLINELQHLNADILLNFVSDNFIKNGSVQRLSSDEERDFMRALNNRRGSSLLMPMENETVMVQKRDSLSALFSGLLPDFIDSSAVSETDIKCHKCQRGMNNMIMIDCDRCHKWYHIKCAHIDSGAIPTNWNCC